MLIDFPSPPKESFYLLNSKQKSQIMKSYIRIHAANGLQQSQQTASHLCQQILS